MSGLLVILSSFSGGGKSTIIRNLLEKHPEWTFSVSATTRFPRPNETDGVQYHFFEMEKFRLLIASGELAEYEEVHGQYYGTLRSSIQQSLDAGELLILDLDVRGAVSVSEAYPEQSLTIFIDVPDVDVLRQRLKARRTESPEIIEKRLSRYQEEVIYKERFQYIIINDDLDRAIIEIEKTIEKRRTK